MKTYIILIFLTGGLFFFQVLNDTASDDTTRKVAVPGSVFHVDTLQNINQLFQSRIPAGMNEFPTIHPFVVHFAISLILAAAIMQLFNLFLAKRDISWIVFLLLLAGLVAAMMSTYNFHPHTAGLSEHQQKVLDGHMLWAQWTIRSGVVAVILFVLFLFLLRRINISEKPSERPKTIRKYWLLSLFITIVMIFSAFSVVTTGHYGAQLVHIEGVGPQGKYLEMDDHH